MTKVKKVKKPKAKGKKPIIKKPVIKKPVKKTDGFSARVEKIDRRLRPTPPPQLVKIDSMLKNPLKINDVQRTQINPYFQTPVNMFSGQDTGHLMRQFDILASKEKQLEGKITELNKRNLNDEILSDMKILDNNMSILDNEYSEQKYNGLKKRLKEINRLIPKDNSELFDFYEKLNDRLENIKKSYDDFDLEKGFNEFYFEEIPEGEPLLKEVKQTNTLLDDKIYKNDLVDEAEILIDEIKNTEVKSVNFPEVINDIDKLITVVEQKKPRGRPKKQKPVLVEVTQTNTLLDDKIIDNNLLDDNVNLGKNMYLDIKTMTLKPKKKPPENEDDYSYDVTSDIYTLKSEDASYYLDEKTGKYEPKMSNRKYEYMPVSGEFKLRENYIEPTIPSIFNKSEPSSL